MYINERPIIYEYIYHSNNNSKLIWVNKEYHINTDYILSYPLSYSVCIEICFINKLCTHWAFSQSHRSLMKKLNCNVHYQMTKHQKRTSNALKSNEKVNNKWLIKIAEQFSSCIEWKLLSYFIDAFKYQQQHTVLLLNNYIPNIFFNKDIFLIK